MNTITQTMRFRQVLIEYSFKHGVTKAAIRYKVNRQYVYRWRKRYDGTLASLADKSHKPHHHPNQHTADELKLITDMRRRSPNAGLVVFWVKLRQEAILVLLQVFTAYSANRDKCLLNHPIPNTYQSLTSKCSIPVREYR